jgi:hypothetical protein
LEFLTSKQGKVTIWQSYLDHDDQEIELMLHKEAEKTMYGTLNQLTLTLLILRENGQCSTMA